MEVFGKGKDNGSSIKYSCLQHDDQGRMFRKQAAQLNCGLLDRRASEANEEVTNRQAGAAC